jgi:hypothetical protein
MAGTANAGGGGAGATDAAGPEVALGTADGGGGGAGGGAGASDAAGPDGAAGIADAGQDGAGASDAFGADAKIGADGPLDTGCQGPPAYDPTAACAAAASATVPFSSAQQLAALVVGDWLRCEGPIQPEGMPVAPDGQFGIEFDLNPGEEQGYASGIIPTGGACLSTLLLYVGNDDYGPTSWAFAQTSSGPGIVFQSTFQTVVYDNPVFSSGGNRMLLTDPTYHGNYVRVP